MQTYKPQGILRKGWTTGACATAAAKAAFTALIKGEFPATIEIILPRGEQPSFEIINTELTNDSAFACVIKDAGDDPDVTHGAMICARVRRGSLGSGVVFRAGKGVGTITKAGLPLAVGEPAINPMPRQMLQTAINEVAAKYGVEADLEIEISVPNGEQLALKTMNPRLGILGGISILGTTGIVIPYSCSAWIHSIHRGIDVARAARITHIAGSTGSTSESAIQKIHSMSETALIDMGDFVGGMLKYLRKHPIEKLTIAGGIGKMCKLAQGMLDLHSRTGAVDLNFIANIAIQEHIAPEIVEQIRSANTAKHAFDLVYDLAPNQAFSFTLAIAKTAWKTAATMLKGSGILLETTIFDREGKLLASTQFQAT